MTKKYGKSFSISTDKSGYADNTKFVSLNNKGCFMFSAPAIKDLNLRVNNHARFTFNNKTKTICVYLTNYVHDGSRPIRIHAANGTISDRKFFNKEYIVISGTKRFGYEIEEIKDGLKVFIDISSIYPKKLPKTIQLIDDDESDIPIENPNFKMFKIQDNKIQFFNQILDFNRLAHESDIEFLLYCVDYGISIGIAKQKNALKALIGI